MYARGQNSELRLGRPVNGSTGMRYHYVYILQNEWGDFYTGRTGNLKARLNKHNAGEVPHTAKHRPWRIKTAIAFTDVERVMEFERYLKSASGRAFARKRL